MGKFRKKPVEIEAWQLTRPIIERHLFEKEPLPAPLDEVLEFRRGCYNPKHRTIDRADFFIKTLEGTLYAIEGDWIIRGVKGEYYPCKPEIFTETYEAA